MSVRELDEFDLQAIREGAAMEVQRVNGLLSATDSSGARGKGAGRTRKSDDACRISIENEMYRELHRKKELTVFTAVGRPVTIRVEGLKKYSMTRK